MSIGLTGTLAVSSVIRARSSRQYLIEKKRRDLSPASEDPVSHEQLPSFSKGTAVPESPMFHFLFHFLRPELISRDHSRSLMNNGKRRY